MNTRPPPCRILLPLLRPCFALVMVAATALAQQATPDAPPVAPTTSGPVVIDAAELTVKYVRPVSRYSLLADALASLYQREYFVRNDDGAVEGPYKSIDNFSDLIVLHDTEQRVQVLAAALAELEQTLAQGENDGANAGLPELVVRQYGPHHQAAENLIRALEPFRRSVSNAPAQGSGPIIEASNISLLKDPALLVLRDTEANVTEMLALLTGLDVPAPQVMVTCTLLRAISTDDTSEAAATLPPQLLAGLRLLVPYQDFSSVGFAALRVAVVAGRQMTMSGVSGDGETFRLAMLPTGFDATSGLLTLDRCQFQTGSGAQFETGTTLRVGEDTVLGASGADPLFVVLRIVSLDG